MGKIASEGTTMTILKAKVGSKLVVHSPKEFADTAERYFIQSSRCLLGEASYLLKMDIAATYIVISFRKAIKKLICLRAWAFTEVAGCFRRLDC
jgi:hypothetical protein